MDGDEINNILKNNDLFLGVCSADQLQNIYENDKFVIVNSECHCYKTGHWICCYFKSNRYCFFDSYGYNPLYYKKIVYPNGVYIHQRNRFQSKFATTCGMYCIYFVDFLTNGGTFNQFIQQFDIEDLEKNDYFVCNYVNEIYETNFSVLDIDMLY